MPREADAQKKIAAFSAARACFALAREPNALTFVHAARNFDLISFRFIGASAPQRHLALRTIERFLERDHDIGFDILAAFRRGRTPAETTAAKRRFTATAAKECFEKIAKPGPAELKLDAVSVCRTTETAGRAAAAPIGRRLKSARLIPIRA